MWFTKYKRGILVWMCMVYFHDTLMRCQAISNTQFNASLRDYASEDNSNSTEVRTLQKDLATRYASQAPVSTVIRFKEVPDSVLSGSSHGRGLLHHHGNGYGLADYEESPHYAYEYHYPDDHHGDHHGHNDDHHHGYHLYHDDHKYGHHDDHKYGHHDDHKHGYHDDHKHGHGHHYKHYDHHALAAKTVLWPIAGIALLGAAAALVTNPVLLQLGVVSGRRKRRDADINNTKRFDRIKGNPDIESILANIRNFNKTHNELRQKRNNRENTDAKRTVFGKLISNNRRLLFSNVSPAVQAVQSVTTNTPDHTRYSEGKHYIPIPLKTKENVSN